MPPDDSKGAGRNLSGERPKMGKPDTGARYEIIVDGVTRTHRDDRKFALGAAALLREKASGRRVVVKDTATQEVIDPPASNVPLS
jgi:hypothetical protein